MRVQKFLILLFLMVVYHLGKSQVDSTDLNVIISNTSEFVGDSVQFNLEFQNVALEFDLNDTSYTASKIWIELIRFTANGDQILLMHQSYTIVELISANVLIGNSINMNFGAHVLNYKYAIVIRIEDEDESTKKCIKTTFQL